MFDAYLATRGIDVDLVRLISLLPVSTYRIHLDELRPDLAPHLEKSLESVPGVQSVVVEVGERCVVVEHDNADREVLVAALREEGFRPSFE